ncbi:hypothetical protein BOX15_Mlig033691g1, partial [Macrostomum lignano]
RATATTESGGNQPPSWRNLSLVNSASTASSSPQHSFVIQLASQPANLQPTSRLAVCSPSNQILLLDRRSLQPIDGQLLGSGHDSQIVDCRFSRAAWYELLTCASRWDDQLLLWDLRVNNNKGGSAAIVRFNSESGDCMSTADISCDGLLLCAGAELDSANQDARIVFWDRRFPTAPLGCYSDSHQDSLARVRFHPSRSRRLLTASLDGLACSFDLTAECEDDALVFTYNAGCGIHGADWIAADSDLQPAQLAESVAYVLTGQEGYALFEAEELGDTLIELDRLPVLGGPTIHDDASEEADDGVTSRVADYIVGPLTCGHHLLVGQHSGRLGVLSLKQQTAPVWLSEGAVGHADTVRCCHWDSETNSLVTGSEDGMLCLWQQQTASGGLSAASRPAESFAKKERQKKRKQRRARMGPVSG